MRISDLNMTYEEYHQKEVFLEKNCAKCHGIISHSDKHCPHCGLTTIGKIEHDKRELNVVHDFLSIYCIIGIISFLLVYFCTNRFALWLVLAIISLVIQIIGGGWLNYKKRLLDNEIWNRYKYLHIPEASSNESVSSVQNVTPVQSTNMEQNVAPEQNITPEQSTNMEQNVAPEQNITPAQDVEGFCFCANCGTKLKKTARFCVACGEKTM